MAPQIGDTHTLKLSEDCALTFAWIPPGDCLMGSWDGNADEQPRHRVRISRGYWLQTTPVTQAQFKKCFPEHTNHFAGRATHPAEQVTFSQALGFCDYLNTSPAVENTLSDAFTARLPTEAEWEYACRAQTDTDYFSGDGIAALHSVGWSAQHPKLKKYTFRDSCTLPVAQLKPSRYGLYDMHGNVWEWCSDYYDEAAYHRRASLNEDPQYNSPGPDMDYLKYRQVRLALKDMVTQPPGKERMSAAQRSALAWFFQREINLRVSDGGDQDEWRPLARLLRRFEENLGSYEGWSLSEGEVTVIRQFEQFCSNRIPDDDSPQRVLRGGCRFASAKSCRSAYRDSDQPNAREGNYGFRVCLGPQSKAP